MKSARVSGMAALMAGLMVLAGCGDTTSSTATDIVGTVNTASISDDRCAENRKAGQITFLTGFDFAASAGIIDAVVAEQLGYFRRMCLDVKVQAGFDTANIPLVSAGKAQFTALGSMSEIADASAKDGNIKAIGVLGHKAIEALAVSDKANVASVADLKNTTMGVLGTIPFSIRLMLVRAGVPLDSLKQVEAGFNPLLLDQGTFSSRPVYKSSEPRQLDTAGVKYHLFDPSAEKVPASFGVVTVNNDFARAHPTATEDFLRAQLKGLEYAFGNPTEAVKMTYAKADPKYYLSIEGEQFRWQTEMALVRESTPSGKNYGYIDADAVRAEIQPLVSEVKSMTSAPALDTLYDTRFVNAVYDGSTVIWPAGEG